MVKKKVDERIRTLIENGVVCRHRSLIILIGDRGRDQVVNLHYILSKASVRSRPSVLWCYKRELGFITHKGKRMRKIESEKKRGIRSADDAENPFELFLSSTQIRFCFYKETHRILGNTYGMCVLQDFSALTPNLLARTVETVEGGGIIVILLKTMSSLKQLYSLSMDVHSRFRTEAHSDVVGRFNERFLLSLADCKTCMVVDDELNILPISSHINKLTPIARSDADDEEVSISEKELRELKASLRDTPPIGKLLSICRTLDQARALLSFSEAISEKSLRSTVALTAARGRGKSAALGLAMATAVAYGYSNIFVTAPSPENLKTLFEMIFKGFDQLEYKEHKDYEIVQSSDPELNHAVVRVNIFHSHRQTIQYISPADNNRLAQAELLVIDEAAAIPLPVVKSLLGAYLVFMSSTVNGYEGTGRSLSLKLFAQLERQSAQSKASASSQSSSSSSSTNSSSSTSSISRSFRKITLDEPIRYSSGDAVESWLNSVLCLNCSSFIPQLTSGVPHPSACDLYYVSRDTLFSHHKASEAFLQRMMALYVSSHYKNTPNDLQLMSDAPAHHLFVLLGPLDQQANQTLPDIFCVIQVCLEGDIAAESVRKSLSRGLRASGDLIPWCVSQQFQNYEFASLSGARIVRIASHPDLMRAGYASRALSLLANYYDGKITNLSEVDLEQLEEKRKEKESNEQGGKLKKRKVEEDPEDDENRDDRDDEDEDDNDEDEMEESSSKAQVTSSSAISSSSSSSSSPAAASKLLTELIAPRSNLPHLLVSLADRPPEFLHYLGVSYGLTQDLYNFWRKNSFLPLYLRQTANELTGEHTCIMVRVQQRGTLITLGDTQWLQSFYEDFVRRFLSLLAFDFKSFSAAMALSLIPDPKNEKNAANKGEKDEWPRADMADMEVETTTDQSTSASSSTFTAIDYKELLMHFSQYDMKRLESYARNLVDYHMILDLIPQISKLFFHKRFPFHLSLTQAAILLAVGLQHKSITNIQNEFGVGSQQLLAQFNKIVRKITTFIEAQHKRTAEKEVLASIPDERLVALRSAAAGSAASYSSMKTLATELNSGAQSEEKKLKEKQKALLQELGSGIEAFAIAQDLDGKNVDKGSNAPSSATRVNGKANKIGQKEHSKRPRNHED